VRFPTELAAAATLLEHLPEQLLLKFWSLLWPNLLLAARQARAKGRNLDREQPG
jgi:hypothetical protein